MFSPAETWTEFNLLIFLHLSSLHPISTWTVRGLGLVQPVVAETSWVGGEDPNILLLNEVKKERDAPGDLWGGKPIVWAATQFRLCFPGAWVVMTWLCPCWIVGLYSVWISWWLHCEGPHSLRSVYPAAGAPPELLCSGAGHSTMDCGKEKSNELRKNKKAKKKSCWKCCTCCGMAVCMRGLIPWVAVSRCSCWVGSVHSGALHCPFQDKIMLVAPTNVLYFCTPVI